LIRCTQELEAKIEKIMSTKIEKLFEPLIQRLQEEQRKNTEEMVLKLQEAMKTEIKQELIEDEPSKIYSDLRVLFQREVTLEFEKNPNASRVVREEMISQFLSKNKIKESPSVFNFFRGKLDETWKGRRSYFKRRVKGMCLKTSVPSISTLQEDDEEEIEKMWQSYLKEQELVDLTDQIAVGQKWNKEFLKYVRSCVESWVAEEKEEWLADKRGYVTNLPQRRQEARAPK